MTKKLEEFFDMEPVDRSDSQQEDQLSLTATDAESLPVLASADEVVAQLDIADRIDRALPEVRGLEIEDRALDDYANQAMESYQKLMDLGFNVDDRNAGKIFEVASTMMNNAITAKTTKLEKKLKMVELQLRAARLVQTQKPEEETNNNQELTTDRNAILNIINQNVKKH